MSGGSKRPRVLAIHAHPDDVEFQCAGTLARLKQAGWHISIATMTAGDCGSAELGPDEIAAVRREEARKSSRLLDADYYCLEFKDLSITVDADGRRRTTEAVRRARPDLVLTAPVRDACFAASAPNFSTHQWDPAPPLERIPHLYYVDAVDGIDWYGNPIEPEFCIDITSTFKLKKQMLACHESQRAWLLRQHGMDEYLESMERWSAARGKKIGVAYAEGFRQHEGHPYPTTNLLWEVLGGAKR
jgi:LmbE family N-acetylglucosaminyl deacetylase